MVRTGEHEGLKAAVHASVCALVGVCAVYNGVAWLVRKERHLAWNTAIYTAGVVLEIVQIARHVEGRSQ